jgi:hypothetical protein
MHYKKMCLRTSSEGLVNVNMLYLVIVLVVLDIQGETAEQYGFTSEPAHTLSDQDLFH